MTGYLLRLVDRATGQTGPAMRPRELSRFEPEPGRRPDDPSPEVEVDPDPSRLGKPRPAAPHPAASRPAVLRQAGQRPLQHPPSEPAAPTGWDELVDSAGPTGWHEPGGPTGWHEPSERTGWDELVGPADGADARPHARDTARIPGGAGAVTQVRANAPVAATATTSAAEPPTPVTPQAGPPTSRVEPARPTGVRAIPAGLRRRAPAAAESTDVLQSRATVERAPVTGRRAAAAGRDTGPRASTVEARSPTEVAPTSITVHIGRVEVRAPDVPAPTKARVTTRPELPPLAESLRHADRS